jgi:hypothetical protein
MIEMTRFLLIGTMIVTANAAHADIGLPRSAGFDFENFDQGEPDTHQRDSLEQTVEQAIPPGTPLSQAKAVLIRAGARCRRDGDNSAQPIKATCSYKGVARIDGDLTEATTWRIAMRLTDGKVSSLAVRQGTEFH